MGKRTERIASVVLMLFGLFVAYYSHRYLKLGILITPGAGFLPFYIGIALAVLGVCWFLKTLLTEKASAGEGVAIDAEGPGGNVILYRFLPGILLVILYAWLFERAGYLISTLLFMLGWQKVVERQRWVKTCIIAVVCALAMYGLFARALKIALPTGLWLP